MDRSEVETAAGVNLGLNTTGGTLPTASNSAMLRGMCQAAMKEYLKGASKSPAHWCQATLIAFREVDYVAARTHLLRGIAANPYIAEGLTGRTVLTEHLYWHASNVLGPEWAIDYLELASGNWTP